MAHVIIIGGSYAGTKVAHRVLADIPQAKVTLVDPSDVFYFNIASPRVLAKPKGIDFAQVLVPIADKFKQYPANRFTFVRGLVSSVDEQTKSVHVQDGATLNYDYLVVASGSTTPGTVGKEAMPFKPTGQNNMRQAIEAAQQRIANASSIVIIGAGPVGVETAGEIAQAYPNKKTTLISSHDRVLPALKPSASKAAASSLEALGVSILYSSRVTETQQLSPNLNRVALQNGRSVDAELVISAAGNLPNTSFLPKSALDSEGWIKVTPELRIASITDGSAFALGDATTFKQRYALKIQDQIPVVVANLKAAISGSKGMGKRYDASDKMMVFVPIGSKTGTGQIGSFVVWGFMVAFAKGKDYFMSKGASFISA